MKLPEICLPPVLTANQKVRTSHAAVIMFAVKRFGFVATIGIPDSETIDKVDK